MTINIPRGKSDAVIEQIKKSLQSYQEDHPNARIDLYRQNSASVRVRIIDPDLAGIGKVQRNDIAWKYLNDLSDDDQSDISMLLLLAPDETKGSLANLEFDDPVPSHP
jgi:hypothetical protein